MEFGLYRLAILHSDTSEEQDNSLNCGTPTPIPDPHLLAISPFLSYL